MHDSFAALLRQPTARRYKQVRSILLTANSIDDVALRLAAVEHCLQQNADEAAARLAELLPGGLLSLQWHRLSGSLALQLGDEQRAQLHRFTYDALAAAIQATGIGTRREPWLVTYLSDGAELLAKRGLKMLSQSLIEDGGRRLDIILCENEREFWFDVSDLLPQTAMAARRLRRPSPGAAAKARPRKKAVSRN